MNYNAMKELSDKLTTDAVTSQVTDEFLSENKAGEEDDCTFKEETTVMPPSSSNESDQKFSCVDHITDMLTQQQEILSRLLGEVIAMATQLTTLELRLNGLSSANSNAGDGIQDKTVQNLIAEVAGNDDGTYNVVNLFKKGTKVPFHLETDPNNEDTAFGTAVEGQKAIAIPVVMSNSENDHDACTKNDDGSYNFPDPSLGMQELNRLVVPISGYLMKGSPISIVFDLNNLGDITLSATLCETNETKQITFNFNKGYDDAKMAELSRRVANIKMFDEI